ncbi:MAG: hypothetical protein ACRCVG_01050, partial [Methanobacteriaceae archaeon]
KIEKKELKTYKKLYSLFKDNYGYINPFYPFYGSTKNIKQRFRKRKVRFEKSKNSEIMYLKIYNCKDYNNNFQTMLENVLDYKKRHTKVFFIQSISNNFYIPKLYK